MTLAIMHQSFSPTFSTSLASFLSSSAVQGMACGKRRAHHRSSSQDGSPPQAHASRTDWRAAATRLQRVRRADDGPLAFCRCWVGAEKMLLTPLTTPAVPSCRWRERCEAETLFSTGHYSAAGQRRSFGNGFGETLEAAATGVLMPRACPASPPLRSLSGPSPLPAVCRSTPSKQVDQATPGGRLSSFLCLRA